jgi:hypothetical protein
MADNTATVEREEERRGRRAPMPSPAVLAVRLERLHAGHRAWRQRTAARKAAENLLPEGLDELVRHVDQQPRGHRIVSACLLHLGGYTHAEIAAALCYSTRKSSATTISKMLQTPAAQRIIETIRHAQVANVLQGTYGVQAQAKAAGPAVMQVVTELAGAQRGTDGERVGRAARDRDLLTAAKLVLDAGGHLVQRREELHVHLFGDMSDAELEELARDGAWPARYVDAGMVTNDGVLRGSSALVAPREPILDGRPPDADRRPGRRGSGR